MNAARTILLSGMAGVLALSATSASANRADKYEFTFQIPYLYEDQIDFDGNANIKFNSDAGFGFSAGYNYSSNFNIHGSFTWNSTGYNAQRVLDDGMGTIDTVGGVFDSFSANLVGDYYFLSGDFTPFISGSLGWSEIDSNIASGPPSSVCWWDPWWGYICDGYQPTYNANTFAYGLGVGLRFDLNERSFIRAGYYEHWMDFDHAKGSPSLGTVSVELGFAY